MRFVSLFFVALSAIFAQETHDFSHDSHTTPIAISFLLPGTCNYGEFRQLYGSGSNVTTIYQCGYSNDWHVFSGSGGGSTPGGVSGDLQVNASGSLGAVHPTSGTAGFSRWNGSAWIVDDIPTSGGELDCATVHGQCSFVYAPLLSHAFAWTGAQDFSGASLTKPARNLASDPGTCAVSEKYFNTTSGKFRNCLTLNTWTDEGGAYTLPAATTSTLGGTKAIDCTGTGHILSIATGTGIPTCSADASGSGATSGNNTSVSGTAVNWVPFDPTVAWIKDEFCGGTNYAVGENMYGELGWLQRSDNTGSVPRYTDSVAGHPCILNMPTDAGTAFGNEMIALVSTDTKNQIPPLNTGSYEFNFVFRMNQTGTSDLYVGLNGEALGSEFGDVNDVYLRYNTGDNANWQFRVCAASACTTTNTGNAADTAWHRLRIKSVSGSATICMDACSSPTAITTMPSVTTMPMFYLGNLSSAVSRSVDIDFFSFHFTGLTRF